MASCTDMVDGQCHFCGNPAEIEYTNHGRVKHYDCRCALRLEWLKRMQAVAELEQMAKDTQAVFYLRHQKEKLEKQLAQTKDKMEKRGKKK